MVAPRDMRSEMARCQSGEVAGLKVAAELERRDLPT